MKDDAVIKEVTEPKLKGRLRGFPFIPIKILENAHHIPVDELDMSLEQQLKRQSPSPLKKYRIELLAGEFIKGEDAELWFCNGNLYYLRQYTERIQQIIRLNDESINP